jgi:hypothetical protein
MENGGKREPKVWIWQKMRRYCNHEKMGFKQQTQIHSARIGIGQTAGFFRFFQAASTRLGSGSTYLH